MLHMLIHDQIFIQLIGFVALGISIVAYRLHHHFYNSRCPDLAGTAKPAAAWGHHQRHHILLAKTHKMAAAAGSHIAAAMVHL